MITQFTSYYYVIYIIYKTRKQENPRLVRMKCRMQMFNVLWKFHILGAAISLYLQIIELCNLRTFALP